MRKGALKTQMLAVDVEQRLGLFGTESEAGGQVQSVNALRRFLFFATGPASAGKANQDAFQSNLGATLVDLLRSFEGALLWPPKGQSPRREP